MNRFPDFQELAVSVIHDDFIAHMMSPKANGHADLGVPVSLVPCRSYKDGKFDEVKLPLALLQSTCVLLSIWQEHGTDRSSKDAINELANVLMFPHDTPESVMLEADGIEGVASAKVVGTGKSAVLVDEVSLTANRAAKCLACSLNACFLASFSSG